MNESHKNAIRLGFLDMHRRMADMEALMARSLTASPFSESINDLSPTEHRVVHGYFAEIRSTMLRLLEDTGIPLEIQPGSVRWLLQCGATFLEIAVAELGAGRMRGYGLLEPEGQAQVVKIQEELRRLIVGLAAYLQHPEGQDTSAGALPPSKT